jgi:hypothetical protein
MVLQAPHLHDEYLRLLGDRGLDLPLSDAEPESPLDAFDKPGEYKPKALVRWLELSTGETFRNWNAIGNETIGAYLLRLATVSARKGQYARERLGGLQGVLDHDVRLLGDAIGISGKTLPFDVYVGVHPDVGFNAVTRPAKGGALVLCNAGLMDSLFQVLKINLAESGGANSPPPLTADQGLLVLADAFNAYLFGNGLFQEWQLPRLDEAREASLGLLLFAAETFVIAHELGHIALGHVRLDESSGHVINVQLTPETELDADNYAVDLVTATALMVVDTVQTKRLLAGGMAITIGFAAIIGALRKRFGITTSSAETHPSSTDRWINLCARLEAALGGPDPLIPGKKLFLWLVDDKLPGIVGILDKVEFSRMRALAIFNDASR